MRYFRQSFQALVDLAALTHAEQDVSVVKAAAEWTNFKLCQLLLSAGSTLDAAFQLRLHLSAFGRLQLARSLLQWRHSEWLAKQHLLFAQLLLTSRVRGGLDLDPAHHLQRAAALTMRRREEFQRAAPLLLGRSPEELMQPFEGFRLQPSRFLGGFPFLESTSARRSLGLSPEGQTLLQGSLAQSESGSDHCTLALTLLRQSLTAIDDKLLRRRALVLSAMAEVTQVKGDHYSALEQLIPLATLLLEQGWVISAVFSLRQLVHCARQARSRREIVIYGFKLYGLARNSLPLEEIQDLHDEIFSVICEEDNKVFESATSSSSSDESLEITVSAEAPLFDISATFPIPSVSVGDTAEITLLVDSRFVQTMQFSKIEIIFSDEVTRHTLLHGNAVELSSDCPSLDENNTLRCPLIFQRGRIFSMRYKFLVAPALLGDDSEKDFFVSKLVFILPVISMTDDCLLPNGSEKRRLEEALQPSSSSVHPPLRNLQFVCTTRRPMDFTVRAKQSSGIAPGDAVKAADHVRYSLISVKKRSANLELNVQNRELLQGVVGRVNLELRTNSDSIIEGMLTMESPSAAPSNPIFWLPHGKVFHPIRDKSTPLTSVSLKLPSISRDRTEIFPLFIRSVTPGSLTIRLSATYSTGCFRSQVRTESEVVLVVAEPVKVRFSITSSAGFYRGLSKDIFSNSVVRGDSVTLSAAVECPAERSGGVRISKLELHMHQEQDSIFSLQSGRDMLQSKEADLSPGELLAGCAQLLCIPSRLDDRFLSNGLRVSRSAFIGSVMVEVAQSGNYHDAHDLGVVESLSAVTALDKEVSAFEMGTMYFYIPQVNLVDSPFDVAVSHKSYVTDGETFELKVKVKSKLNSIARVSLKLDLGSTFLITGETSKTTDVRNAFFTQRIIIFLAYTFRGNLPEYLAVATRARVPATSPHSCVVGD